LEVYYGYLELEPLSTLWCKREAVVAVVAITMATDPIKKNWVTIARIQIKGSPMEAAAVNKKNPSFL
jgi:hypothetical protein